MIRTDVAVIGAGLLGCFTARALRRYDLSVTVFERGSDVSTGISRANTGILYSGCDTRPDTLKSRMTVRSSLAFPALCAELSVPFLPCGSLMVSCGEQSEAALRRKYEQGTRNGAPGLRLLSGDEARELEPGLSREITGALLSPTTGTVDPWELCIAAFENARANGADFRFGQEVCALARRDGGFLVETAGETCLARAVVNCAGLAADAVRELLETPAVRIFPDAGDYLVLDAGAPGFPSRVIFQETEEGKGVTLVPTVDGSLLVGPTERELGEGRPYESSALGIEELCKLSRRVMPGLPLDRVIRNFAAVRPNPYEVEERGGVWVPREKSISGYPIFSENGLISFIGIKTPGLTCSQGLGEHASKLVLEYLGGAALNPAFEPRRTAIPRVRELPDGERAALIARDGAYGEILCRCRGITRGEVREAIARGASSVEGVKRRVGTGMGRCQGGYCMQRIWEELRRAGVEEPTRDGPGSPVVQGGTYGTL